MVSDASDANDYLQRMSKQLLGQALRLQVAAAVSECEDSELYPEAVAEKAGVKEARASEQLQHFAKAGLMTPLERDGRRQPYARRDSVYWSMCRKLRNELLRNAEGSGSGSMSS